MTDWPPELVEKASDAVYDALTQTPRDPEYPAYRNAAQAALDAIRDDVFLKGEMTEMVEEVGIGVRRYPSRRCMHTDWERLVP